MKKLVLLLGLFIMGGATAQTLGNQKPVNFGVKGGLNIANLSNSGGKAVVGYHAGVFLNARLSEKFGLQPEVLYTTQGSKGKETLSDDFGNALRVKGKIELGYVSVPVMVQYYPTPAGYLELGPQLGFLASAKLKATASGVSASQDIKELIKSFDLGVGFGIGYHFTSHLTGSMRFTGGLIDVMKEDHEGKSLNNGVLQIGLNYQL